MIATLLWMSVSGAFTVWVCTLVSCPTPPGYIGQHRYTGEKKQWLVYGLSEGFVAQIQTWNGEDGEGTSEEARHRLAEERVALSGGREVESAALVDAQYPIGVSPAREGSGSCGDEVHASSRGVEERSVQNFRYATIVAYAQPVYLGGEYPAEDFRRVLVDHLVTAGGRDPVLANA